MRIPTIQGIIDRRILINFVADPAIIQRCLPAPFSPRLYKGKAIVGICLIRLTQMRPKGFPAFAGISSENAAHRIAVEWRKNGEMKSGVFIPRRDTSSLFNVWAGGRIFPGKHFYAKVYTKENDGKYEIAFKSDGITSIFISAETTDSFSPRSVFSNLSNASRFFESGAIGYSPNSNKYDGLELKIPDWKVTPLNVAAVQSGFFENESVFPTGTVRFDNALLMTDIQHEWRSVK